MGWLIGLFASATILPAASAPRTFAVVVVQEGSATTSQVAEARSALRSGIAEAGARLVDDVTTVELMRMADATTGRCDEACERRMRAELSGSTVVLGRLSANEVHFALRVAADDREWSAAGSIQHLADGARRIGRQLASANESGLLIKGGPPGAEFFVDGARVVPDKDGRVRVAPGSRVVRVGTGMARHAMVRIDLSPGEILAITFPDPESTDPLKIATVVNRRPAVVPTPGASATPVRHVTSREATAGMALSSRSHSLSGTDRGAFSATFTGIGPVVAATIERGAPYATLEASWIDYRGSDATFELEDGMRSTVHGGATMRARAAGAWRFSLDRAALAPMLGFSFERHTSDDVKGPDGDVGVLVDYSRLALDVALQGTFSAGQLAWIDATLGLSPWSSWQESPESLGSNATSTTGTFWRVGVDVIAFEPWTFRLAYDGEVRGVRHSGEAAVPMEPPLRNARLEETFHFLSLSIRHDF